MKHLLLLLVILTGSLTMPDRLSAQSFTTESKSCGSCHKPVSNNSRVGMTCPHCGVRWGYENEQRTREYDTYRNYTSVGITTSKANLRSGPSKSASIIAVVPPFTSVTISSKTGDWYYVECSIFDNNFRLITETGYIHKSLIQ
jgi:hypothetical protein